MVVSSVREFAHWTRDKEEIFACLEDLRLWWAEAASEGTPPYDQLLMRVHDLRQLMAAYFGEREQAWREAGEESSPAERDRLNWRIRRNAMLLADLDQMMGRMQMCGPDLDCWAEASRTFEVLLKKLRKQEGEDSAAG